MLVTLEHISSESTYRLRHKSRRVAPRSDRTLHRHVMLGREAEDSGPGIDKDELGGIFTAFVTTKPHGMGLGLAIARMITDYHGGQLTAASDSKYGGASFQFVLPTADRR